MADVTFKQSDVTRAVKGAVAGYRATGLIPGAVTAEIRGGAVHVRIEPMRVELGTESPASRRHEEVEAFAEAVRARAARRA